MNEPGKTSAISDTFRGWTLFLDRDGVINHRLPGDYVKSWNEFQFIDGVLDALRFFRSYFGIILIVTNQQGVAKGLMTERDLEEIHQRMLDAITRADGKIDRIYSCTRHENTRPFCRKPMPGMALKARKDFPTIHFKKSIMAGDSYSDMLFGKQLGMTTFLINSDNHIARLHPHLVDYWCPSLISMAHFLSGTSQ